MRDFFLSKNTNFDFKLFELQHICLISLTILGLLLIYKYKSKISALDSLKIKKSRNIMVFIIILNMFLYRGSYMYYGVYNIKVHLSLYYCHLVNYMFAFGLLINYKNFYKILYVLIWIGAFWTVSFPDISGGMDCFIFYSSFISHNLVLIFVTYIVTHYKIKLNFKDLLLGLFVCLCIFICTHLINLDFGTNFNSPYSILKDYVNVSIEIRYLLLIAMGILGSYVGYIVNKLYCK